MTFRFLNTLLLTGPCLLLSCCQTPQTRDSFTTPQTLDELRSQPAIQAPVRHRKKIIQKSSSKEIIPALFKQKVSIAIGEQLPLKVALLSLTQQTGIDLQIDQSVKNKIIYSVKNRPFIDVIRDICEMTNLRYSIHNASIRIERDLPYPKNYKIHFLNLDRTTENETSIATNVFANGDEANKQIDNGSNSNIKAKSESNFWDELQGNLEIIMGEQNYAKDDADTKEDADTKDATKIESKKKQNNQKYFTINKQGGILTVRATSQQHKLIRDYLTYLKKATSTQVLIEAKIIEVNLKDEFKAGINWEQFKDGIFRMAMPLGKIAFDGKLTDPMHHQQDILTIGTKQGNFQALLQAIQQFGTCRTLSSPRVTVLNNQNAILKVAQNQVYFRLRYDRDYSFQTNRESVSYSSDIQTVPIGFVMSVQPSINEDTGNVVLALRPTISRLSRSVSDPAVELAYANSSHHNTPHHPSLIPVVEVREIDSVLEIESGRVAILGGLMESRSATEDTHLPGIGDIPFIGKLVSAKSEVDEVIELVILLKATIVDQPEMDDADERLVNDYIEDPRPFRRD